MKLNTAVVLLPIMTHCGVSNLVLNVFDSKKKNGLVFFFFFWKALYQKKTNLASLRHSDIYKWEPVKDISASF